MRLRAEWSFISKFHPLLLIIINVDFNFDLEILSGETLFFRIIVSFDCSLTFADKPKSINSPKSTHCPKIPLSLQNVKMSEVPIKKAKLDDDDRTEEKVEESETVVLTPEQQTKLDIELLDACRDNASIVNVRGLIESGAGLGLVFFLRRYKHFHEKLKKQFCRALISA